MTHQQKNVISNYKYKRDYFRQWLENLFRKNWNEYMKSEGVL